MQILQFNKALIDALYDVVPAIKPQAAYYEMYGLGSVRTLGGNHSPMHRARACSS